jgi:glycerol-3-phosphate dehydrogenase
VDELAPFFPALAGKEWTGGAPLPGGDFGLTDAEAKVAELSARYPFLSQREAHRLIRLYGTLAFGFLGSAATRAELGADFGHGLTAAEVNYLVNVEWAQTTDDILWRRTKLGLHFTEAETARLAAYLLERTSPA